ncbi:DUF3016 domain-containing protein [Pseudidiomarina sp. CB1]|uniref:DUF3016 domain-containing protein n=1 Tax=Pseudidiomarina sp. CB1 TaxID=2972484 RepID=UPI0021629791|nr:DUF3016 domain-containing protein [Pseudidiomarina sp. CB1]
MKNITMLTVAVAAALFSVNALAAEVKVEWKDVDSYRDIEAVNDIQSRFEKQIMDGLTEHWKALGAKLPDDHKLTVTMTDLDIAGRVEPTYGSAASSHMRILDDISYPAMSFAFTYTDANGNVIAEDADVRLKDMGANSGTMRSAVRSGRDALFYEKRLMDGWFDKQFKASIN